ncbi:MAG: ankyrin repeat domain-containing protein, partial [Alphaproteobacteria bacterium]|nr:ankyrin repeat domain-containing protein [Alphaproteobacteria bacterium]
MSVGVVNNWGWASSTLSDAENVFLEAIKTGNTQKIQELIASGTDINEKLDCDVPLAIAVSYKQPEVIRLLLDNQADFTALSSMDRYRLLFLFRTELQSFITKYNIDVQAADEHGISLIQRAIFQGDLEFFKIFLQISGRLKNDIIHEVVQNCSVEFLQYLIQEGYDINALNASGEPLIVSAVRSGNEEMVRTLVDTGIDINAVTVNGKKISLYDYIPSGNREMFQMLVACNASFQETTEEGDTELHKAVRNGDIFKIRSLIAAGIDVNVQNEAGNTAMHLAMEKNHQVAYVLMSECRVHNVSLNLNLQNYDGNTPFHFLVTKQSRISALLPIMLENGANINVQNNEGNTPLHFAGKLLNLEAIQLFLANGANPYIQNFWGNTPYHFVHSHRTNPRLTRSVWECIALFNDQNIDIRRLSTTENKSGQSVQSMGREEFQFPLIDESSIPRIYSLPRPQTPLSSMPAPIDFDAPMVSNGPPIPILPPQPLEESNIPILPVQVEPMQHSESDISPMMDPPPLNPTPPMPPMDKEEIKHEDVPLAVDAVPPAPQSEIPLPQPTSIEMPPQPPVQVEPMQHSGSDISPMMDPPPLNPTPPMPPMDKEEIKHEDVPLSVDAVPPAPQSEIPLPQPTSIDIIMSEQSNSFVLESVVPISINTDVLASTTNIPVPEPLSVESIISTEDVSGEGISLENDAVVDSNEHNSLIGRDVITDNLGEPSVQSNLLHGQGNGEPPIGIAATEIVPFSTSGINNTLIENNHQIDNDGLNQSRENTSLGENVNTENRQEEITNNFDERDNESRHTATSGKQNELKNSENGVNTGEHLSSQGNGFSHVSGAGESGDDRIGRGTPLSCHGKSGVCSGENSKGNESGTGTEPPLLGYGNGAGSAEQNDGREDDGFPMNGLSCKEDDDSENRRMKSKKKKQKSVEFFIPPIIPEESENKDDLMCFDPGVVCENSQGMQIVNRKRKNEKKRIDVTNISPEKLNFWERNWKWIVGVATVVAATLGAYFLIRKAKKKTKAVKSETERLKSQIKTLQRSISDMTNGVSDKDIQKPSV